MLLGGVPCSYLVSMTLWMVPTSVRSSLFLPSRRDRWRWKRLSFVEEVERRGEGGCTGESVRSCVHACVCECGGLCRVVAPAPVRLEVAPERRELARLRDDPHGCGVARAAAARALAWTREGGRETGREQGEEGGWARASARASARTRNGLLTALPKQLAV